jgi:serine/threonine protein kinase/tetratricopeptide (TPR) repeat protein
MRVENITAAPPSADRMAQALEEYLAAAEVGTAPPREEFLARHPELADDLDACLAALRFIGRAAAGPRSVAAEVAGAESPEQVSGQLGDFRLVREVGRGGMGVVYEAEQISLGRRVALKVLPFAATMDPRQLQRFHNEARAAASLDHPRIVHVHAVGCERGVHYYAMQFIEGQTLAAVIADLRQSGGKPVPTADQPTAPHVPGQMAPAAETAPQAAASTEQTRLNRTHYRRAAELGIQAAEALDHAHQLGIVHRDVKPANLLVDGRGGLWVTDFGLAHIQSDARLTMTGDLVGTLRYMSPEQALAQRVLIDHRTDIYSLGATVYELLTLEPAFRGADRQELLRQIAFEEPRPPRRLNKTIPAELETIVLKAMEKNPADRYATAKDLADDLRRWLTDEPIRARPAGVVRRLRKWGRRHRAAARAAAAAVVVMLAVLAGTAGWWLRDRAIRERDTEQAVNTVLQEAERLQGERRIPEALMVAQRAEAVLTAGAATPGLQTGVRERLADLQLAADLEDVPLQWASALKDGHFDYDLADGLYRDVFRKAAFDVEGDAAQKVGARIGTTSVAAEVAAALDNWAYVRLVQHGPADAGRKQLLQVARAADPDPWRGRLREALEQNDRTLLLELASSGDVFRLLPGTLHALARALPNEQEAGRALALLRKARRRHPGDFWINEVLGLTLQRSTPPDLDGAIRFYTAAVSIRPLSAGAHINLGRALREKRDVDEAVAEFRTAIGIKDSAKAHNELGLALRDQGDIGGAIAEYREALRLKKDYPPAHTNLGNALQDTGDVDGAIAEHREAIRLNRDYAPAHTNLGNALRDQGDVDGAIAEHREAIRLQGDFATAHSNLGMALQVKGDVDGAIAEYREAIRLKGDYAIAHNNLGSALAFRGDTDGALAAFRQAVSFQSDNAEMLLNLGFCLRDKGQLAEALTYLRRGHEVASKTPRLSALSAQWVKECERLAELEPKLPALLSGQESPADPAEKIEYARLCEKKHLYTSAARFYREAITAKPDLASAGNGLRYDAACVAARAGAGAGEDAARITDAERAGFRRQALDWLRADLNAWRRLLDKQPDKARGAVVQRMRHWLGDGDFAGVRGPDALAKLPEAERQDWQKLWADVQHLLDHAADKPPSRGAEKKP